MLIKQEEIVLDKPAARGSAYWGQAHSISFIQPLSLETNSDAGAIPSFTNLGSCPCCVSFLVSVSAENAPEYKPKALATSGKPWSNPLPLERWKISLPAPPLSSLFGIFKGQAPHPYPMNAEINCCLDNSLSKILSTLWDGSRNGLFKCCSTKAEPIKIFWQAFRLTCHVIYCRSAIRDQYKSA